MSAQVDMAREAEAAVRAAAVLLAELRDGHRRLEARAAHVEAELCRTNDELARKVDELERTQRSLEAVLAAIPTGVVVFDAAGRVARANEVAAAILGTTAAELVGGAVPPSLCAAPADGTRVEVTRPDGTRRVVARRRSEVRLDDGARVATVESLDDQTDLARAEERMRRLDRAAALGTMVGGVAHEVRNPLHAISGFSELLLREAAPGTKTARHAERIRAGVADLEAIVASMLGVAGHGKLALERSALRPVLEAAVAAARAGRDDANHVVTIEAPDAIVTVGPIELRQAVRNLVANALDAQPGGGRVAVTARLAAEGALTVTVDDAGPGVPPHVRERVFDPFFTTRAAGTGLGLALVSRIAALHGGVLELAPEPGPLGGASFSLRLPAAAATSSPTTSGAAGVASTDLPRPQSV